VTGRSLAVAARSHPSALLFAVQIIGVVAYPAMNSSGVGRTAFNVFGLVVVMLALWAVRYSPGLTWVGVLLAVPAAGLLVVQAAADLPDLAGWSSAFEAALYFYAAGCMLAYMLADHQVTRDELWAVGATFTLVAWAFAHVYVVCQALQPLSFTAAVHANQDRNWIELLFLSFTTLSSTGLSDIVPIRSTARALVMLEQLAGLAYVVMFVSRVVGLTLAQNRRDNRSVEPPDID
jgi:Ion channel